MFLLGIWIGIALSLALVLGIFYKMLLVPTVYLRETEVADHARTTLAMEKSRSSFGTAEAPPIRLETDRPCTLLVIHIEPDRTWVPCPVQLVLIGRQLIIKAHSLSSPIATITEENHKDSVLALIYVEKIRILHVHGERQVLHLLPLESSEGIIAIRTVGAKDRRDSGQNPQLRSQWKAVAFVFETPRIASQWYYALNAGTETLLWMRHMRQVDQLGALDLTNTLLFRIFQANTVTPDGLELFVIKKVRKQLLRLRLPSILQPHTSIELVALDLGIAPPTFSNPQFLGKTHSGEISVEGKLSYGGGLCVVLLLTVQIKNFKLPKIVLTVRVLKAVGQVHLSMDPPPAEKMWIGFTEPPELEFHARPHILGGGEKRVLRTFLATALPDITGLVGRLVRKYIASKLMLPNLKSIRIPTLKRSSRHVTPIDNPENKPV